MPRQLGREAGSYPVRHSPVRHDTSSFPGRGRVSDTPAPSRSDRDGSAAAKGGTLPPVHAERRRVRLAAWLLGFAMLSPRAHASGPGAARASTAELAQALRGADAAAAVEALGKRRDAGARAALTEFVRAGQPDALTDRALHALGEHGSQETLGVLAEFTRHRRASARIAAYAAIARIPGGAASELLAQGLRDSDAGVRGACARHLAERGAREQLEPLLRAFARGVPEAAYAVGRLAPADQVARFEEQLGRLPLPVMLSGYEQFLLRSDLGEATKLELCARLGEVASVPVKRFLEQLLATRDWSKQPRLRHALTETARRIAAHPSGRPAGEPRDSRAPAAPPTHEERP